MEHVGQRTRVDELRQLRQARDALGHQTSEKQEFTSSGKEPSSFVYMVKFIADCDYENDDLRPMGSATYQVSRSFFH